MAFKVFLVLECLVALVACAFKRSIVSLAVRVGKVPLWEYQSAFFASQGIIGGPNGRLDSQCRLRLWNLVLEDAIIDFCLW
ncbi:hypothetical protein IQ07DRAFT_588930 [Pyrenochaeta sp. DS3sAY3a]|nr:hypothetical protein IQ07DRAFT_588930 [Pyrenochaeta sp. DS3sAY3a]